MYLAKFLQGMTREVGSLASSSLLSREKSIAVTCNEQIQRAYPRLCRHLLVAGESSCHPQLLLGEDEAIDVLCDGLDWLRSCQYL